MKQCQECYWRFKYSKQWCARHDNKPESCDGFKISCTECGASGEYKIGEYVYCTNCIIGKANIEESTVTHYYVDGEHIGSDNDMEEVIENINDAGIFDDPIMTIE